MRLRSALCPAQARVAPGGRGAAGLEGPYPGRSVRCGPGYPVGGVPAPAGLPRPPADAVPPLAPQDGPGAAASGPPTARPGRVAVRQPGGAAAGTVLAPAGPPVPGRLLDAQPAARPARACPPGEPGRRAAARSRSRDPAPPDLRRAFEPGD